MDAKEFFREQTRMLNAYGRISDLCTGVLCADCPLLVCGQTKCITEESVDIVEAWSKEHPRRTYLDVLLEAFPNTELGTRGIPAFCVGHLDQLFDCDSANEDCVNCWNAEYEEDK